MGKGLKLRDEGLKREFGDQKLISLKGFLALLKKIEPAPAKLYVRQTGQLREKYFKYFNKDGTPKDD